VRAVTYQSEGEVRVEEVPDPQLQAPGDAVIQIDTTGVCGSDLHIYHGRVKIEPGFTLGHEYVGTVLETGDAVTRVKPGDRVLGCFHSACGKCFFCRRGIFQKCDQMRTFGHGATLGSLQGTQAERALIPSADLTLRKLPSGISDEVALFAGDVMGTGYHAVVDGGVSEGDSVAVLGLGPVGLCAVQAAFAAGAARVFAIDSVAARLEVARSYGAVPIHLTEESPREVVKRATETGGADVVIDAVGHPEALDLALRLARKAGTVVAIGVYAEPVRVHMGVVWIKSLTLKSGQANVIGHVDRVLELLSAGTLDPTALVTHHMTLDQAPDAYAIYDRREALKIILRP
jgi:alcohol dehydrogenase